MASDQNFVRWLAYFVVLFIGSQAGANGLLESSRPLPPTAFTVTRDEQRLTLLTSGLSSLHKRLQLIASAQQSIETEFYIYANDQVGRLYTQALVKKAREGVRVRILVDRSYDSPNLNPIDAGILAENKIELRYYNPASWNLIKGNHRNHRKSLIVDGRSAVIGGRNMAEDFFGFHQEYNMLDTDVAIEGSLVGRIQASFENFWISNFTARAEKIAPPALADFGLESESIRGSVTDDSRLQRYKRAQKDYLTKLSLANKLVKPSDEDLLMLARIGKYGDLLLQNETSGICNETYYFADLPGNSSQSRVVYQQMERFLSTAQTSVAIESPFFIKTERESLFKKLLARNVQVEILTNSFFSADVDLSIAPFYLYAKELAAAGAHFFVYEGDSPRWLDFANPLAKTTRWGTHAKTIVLDDNSIWIGSFNMDPRSAFHNSELAIVCRNNPQLAAGLKLNLERRKSITVGLNQNAEPTDGRTLLFNADGYKKMMYYLKKPFGILLAPLL
jgi:putative cardiolipin synthase